MQSTAVGYAGGLTPNPLYEEVCSGLTGHAEVVRVVFDPSLTSYEEMLRIFWEHHDPTQGMRQGHDVGTQYRSAAYYYDESQRRSAEASRDRYQDLLRQAGLGPITTEIAAAPAFYYAEDYHQQYLDKNPNGYCPDHGTGVACPVGVGVTAERGEGEAPGGAQPYLPSTISTSVPQTPTATASTSIEPSRGSGSGTASQRAEAGFNVRR